MDYSSTFLTANIRLIVDIRLNYKSTLYQKKAIQLIAFIHWTKFRLIISVLAIKRKVTYSLCQISNYPYRLALAVEICSYSFLI